MSADPAPARLATPDRRHRRMREVLAQCGERGATIRQLQGWLSGEGLNASLAQLQGWLTQDSQASLVRGGLPGAAQHWIWEGQ